MPVVVRTTRFDSHTASGRAFVSATGVILSAVYALSLYRRVVFGTLDNPKLIGINDLETREVAIFVPLIIGTLALGVYPDAVFNYTAASVDHLIEAWRASAG